MRWLAKASIYVVLLVPACSSDTGGDASTSNNTDADDSESDGSDEAPQGDCADDPVMLTWENFGDAYTANWCRGCHSASLEDDARNGAPDGVNFNSHQDVIDQLDRFTARAADDPPTMPPTGGPSDENLTLLRRWIECGVP